MSNRVKNFLRGMGTVITVCPQTNTTVFVSHKSVSEALGGDWAAIGQDMRIAISSAGEESQLREQQEKARQG